MEIRPILRTQNGCVNNVLRHSIFAAENARCNITTGSHGIRVYYTVGMRAAYRPIGTRVAIGSYERELHIGLEERKLHIGLENSQLHTGLEDR